MLECRFTYSELFSTRQGVKLQRHAPTRLGVHGTLDQGRCVGSAEKTEPRLPLRCERQKQESIIRAPLCRFSRSDNSGLKANTQSRSGIPPGGGP